jgi:phosphoribosylaminoimidazole-succinocarboxamide synthase
LPPLEFDILDKKYELGLLLPGEKQMMDNIICDLEKIWSLEEIKGRQRSRDRNIKEGDRNTAYFQAIANQRARKKRILALDSPNGTLEDTKDMLSHVVDFYKNLFGAEEELGVHLRENFLDEEDKVTMLKISC